jgi:hypothetical protein
MIDQGAVQIDENHICHRTIISWRLSLMPEGGASFGAESVALTSTRVSTLNQETKSRAGSSECEVNMGPRGLL